MVKIVSIDIGIRNLAMCVINCEPESDENKILFWKNVDILESDEYISESGGCQALYKSGANKGKCCTGRAVVCCEDVYYCCRHNPDSKKYKPKKTPKTTSATLQKMCQYLTKTINKYPILLTVGHVAVEQQPSKNPKMKAMSFFLYAYFIMKGVMSEDSPIEKVLLVSPRNKLKVYTGPAIVTTDETKSKYKKRKSLGVAHCQQLLQNDQDSLNMLNGSRKADDLADCFLQGIWYLTSKTKKEKAMKTKAKVKAAKVKATKVKAKVKATKVNVKETKVKVKATKVKATKATKVKVKAKATEEG